MNYQGVVSGVTVLIRLVLLPLAHAQNFWCQPPYSRYNARFGQGFLLSEASSTDCVEVSEASVCVSRDGHSGDTQRLKHFNEAKANA